MNNTTIVINKKHAFSVVALFLAVYGIFAQCPDNIAVTTSGGQCGATVTYTTPGGGSGGQSANGIVNPSAANGLTGWTINLNGGSGWATEGNFFKTSYAMCTKSQVVTLSTLGVNDTYLDTAPAITVSDDYIGWESNYSDTYNLTVELRGAADNVIATWSTGNITTSATLQTASHTFTGYGPGVRKVYFSHGGIDVEYWLGNFGAAMTNSQVKVTLPAGGTAVQTAGLASGSFFPVGTTTNTFTITDGLGNVTNCSFNVIVTDDNAPIVITQPLTVALDASGLATITAAQVNNNSTDNCEIATYTLNTSTFDCSTIGTNDVILSVTDIHGNTATGPAVITVIDNILPIAVAQDVTVALTATGTAVITPEQVNNGSTDNCSLIYALDISSFTCEDLGENMVLLTVTDAGGNSETATAIVTVEDTVAPTAIAQDITVSLDVEMQAVITAESINNESVDNCGIESYSLDITTFTCDDIGENTVTLTVTDAFGNIATDTAIVTVNDSGNYCDTSGIHENAFSGVTIYPNPTSGSFTISGLEGTANQLALYDISGRLVKNMESATMFDISQVNAGVYFLKISASAGSVTKKIVKQ